MARSGTCICISPLGTTAPVPCMCLDMTTNWTKQIDFALARNLPNQAKRGVL